MLLILDGKAAERFEAAAEPALGSEAGALPFQAMAMAGGVLGFRRRP